VAELKVLDHGGEGKALVLVHAFPLDSEMFRGQLGLGSDLRLVTLDLPGFGGSAPRPGDGRMEALAGMVFEAMDQVGLERAALCGVSIGGYILFEMWRQHPERISELVLCDTRPEADGEDVLAARGSAIRLVRLGRRDEVLEGLIPRLLAPASMARPELLGAVKEMAGRTSDDGVIFAQQAMAERSDSVALLESISVPTLVLVGEEDGLTPPEVAGEMAGRIPGAQLEVLPGAGHLSPLEAPEAFNRAVGRFLL